MSRSGYSDDFDQWEMIMWRGAVASAIRGKRGQAFLREMIAALEAMPEKRLAANDTVDENNCRCALAVVAESRGVDLEHFDTWDHYSVSDTLAIARAMAQEIIFENDDCRGTPERRWQYIRDWAQSNLREQQG